MAKYYVRDTFGYITGVKADRYAANSLTGTFEFEAKNDGAVTRVASFPFGNVISIVEVEKTFDGISLLDEVMEEPVFSDDPDEGCEENCALDDVCPNCGYCPCCCPDGEENPRPEEPPTPPVPELLKAVNHETGKISYGFVTPEGFVGFENKSNAAAGLASHLQNSSGWFYTPIEDYTLTEVENG